MPGSDRRRGVAGAWRAERRVVAARRCRLHWEPSSSAGRLRRTDRRSGRFPSIPRAEALRSASRISPYPPQQATPRKRKELKKNCRLSTGVGVGGCVYCQRTLPRDPATWPQLHEVRDRSASRCTCVPRRAESGYMARRAAVSRRSHRAPPPRTDVSPWIGKATNVSSCVKSVWC